jgi:putative transposase
MKTGKFSVEQIIKILKENEAGVKVADLCRKYGFSDATYYNWKAKYGGMEVSEARRLKQLEEENNRLKKLVAELTLDKQAMEEIIQKKW